MVLKKLLNCRRVKVANRGRFKERVNMKGAETLRNGGGCGSAVDLANPFIFWEMIPKNIPRQKSFPTCATLLIMGSVDAVTCPTNLTVSIRENFAINYRSLSVFKEPPAFHLKSIKGICPGQELQW